MPAPFEKPAKPPEGLPDPELNPMTNPLLAKNMGRWAEVYFTSPPEKREAAVQQLLQELRKEQNQQTVTPEPQPPAPPRDSSAAPSSQESIPVSSTDPGICPACLHRNRESDRFCGLCGFPLASEHAEPAKSEVATASQAHPSRSEPTQESWEWLRERKLATLPMTSKSSASKYVIAAILVIACAIASYVVWGRRTPISQAVAGHVESSSQGGASPATTAAEPPAASVVPKQAPSAESAAPAETSTAAADTAEPSHGTDGEADSGGGDDGTQELSEGKKYLTGDGVARDSRTASQWLWRAVAKQNAEAVLLLSDLYIRGDGVPQSCDQARVLLIAAAKRGSPQAGQKLATMRQTECP